MNATFHIFHYVPSTKKNNEYIAWLDKVEAKKMKIWKKYGIYELIQLPRVGHPYWQNMLVVTLYFWESTTNTFQFPCGMATPILCNVEAIIDLRLTTKVFYPTERGKDTNGFNSNWASFARYINDHKDTTTEELRGIKHISFLAIWL